MPRRCGFTRSLAQAPPSLESPKQDSFQIESTLPCKVRWGPDQGCLPLMGKDVDFLPAGNVERGARGQELEAGPCQALAALARQHDIQLGAPVVQMQDVRSEEHTSELQSLLRISYAVFCLNKKNTT